ncbi:MAG: NrtA/SsuA/CpmA family ABC transporter substrate-binding protein [bacterium]
MAGKLKQGVRARWRTALALLGLTALLGAGIFLAVTQQPPRSASGSERIVLAAETVPHASPVWVAQAKGYFRKHGPQVEIREFESGRTALATMLNREGIDLCTAAQTPVISHSFTRDDYAIIGGMVYSDRDVKLLARRDRGVHAPQELKGRTVGITRGSSGHFFLSLFLACHGLELADVQTTDMEATRLTGALLEGQVDAIATWEPHIYQARSALRDQAVLLPSSDIYREDFYFIARKDFIRRHPRALERFLRAIEMSQRFILENGRDAREVVRRRLQVDGATLDATWDDFHFTLFLDQSILLSLEDEARWAIDNRLTDATRVPNYLDYIYADALKAVKPEAVTIVGKEDWP